jgi:hypothetical protein
VTDSLRAVLRFTILDKVRPVLMRRVTWWLAASPIVLVALAGFMTEGAEARARHNLAYASVASLKANIGSRRNLEFDDVRVTDAGATCIQYRARDQAGGVSHGQAVVHGSEVAQRDARHGEDGKFEKEWNRQCLGLSHDVTRAVDRFF